MNSFSHRSVRVLPLLAASLLIGGLSAQAASHSAGEVGEARDNLLEQVGKLRSQRGASCPRNGRDLLTGRKALRVSLFYGYENYEQITVDAVHAEAFARVLSRTRCGGGLEACGFRMASRRPGLIRLQKSVRGTPVSVNIYYTSVSDNNDDNTGVLEAEQAARSEAIFGQFQRELAQSDVVFFAGHSRLGSGPGFYRPSLGQDAVNLIFRLPFQSMLTALQQRPSRLQILGLFSCESDQYYRSEIHRANPNVDLILSTTDLSTDAGEQTSIGALNSILTRRCGSDLQDALTSGEERMEYVHGRARGLYPLPQTDSLSPHVPAPRLAADGRR